MLRTSLLLFVLLRQRGQFRAGPGDDPEYVHERRGGGCR